MVVCPNLAKQKLSFLFAKISFWHECEGPETLAVWGGGAAKRVGKTTINES